MQNQFLKYASMSVISMALISCSDQDNPSSTEVLSPSVEPQTNAPADSGDAIVNMRSGINLPPLAGGSLAQDQADATASVTNALNGVVPGSPLAFGADEADDDDFRPSPPSIGADIPVTYFGPAPSSVNPNLIGPVQLLLSGTVDIDSGPVSSITLPLYKGRLASGGPNNGASFLYVVTDTSDENNAAALGLNFSAKLNFADLPTDMLDTFMASSVRSGFYDDEGVLIVDGGYVDFKPIRSVVPGSTDTSGTSNLIPQLSTQPGAVGTDVGDPDGFYSPLVMIKNAGNHIYNAPVISFSADDERLLEYCDGIPEIEEEWAGEVLHDSVLAICPGEGDQPGTVTLELVNGFSFGRPVLYLSMDSNVSTPAALEKAVFAPALGNIPVGRDDSLFSAVERLFGFTNGPTNDFGESNPQRQGFNSAIVDGGGPLNVLGGVPTIATDYSPLWDVNLGEWTQEAIDNDYRSRMTEEFAILGMVSRGFVTGPGGGAYGSSGVIVNCPIVQRLL